MRNLALTVALALSGALLLADTPDYATLKFYDRMVVSDGATGTGGQLVNTGYLPNGKTLLKAKYNITATTTPEGKAFNQCLYCARKGTNRTASNPDFTFFLEVRTASNGSRIDYYDKTFPCGTEMAAKAGVDTELTVDNGSGTLRVGANEYKVTTVAWPEQGASTARELVANGSLEKIAANGTVAEFGGKPGRLMADATGNHFIRLVQERPGAMTSLYRKHDVSGGYDRLAVSVRARITGLVRGSEKWYDARIIFNFKNDAGKVVKTDAVVFGRDTADWVVRRQTVAIPPDARTLEYMIALFNCKAGAFDFDDIRLTLLKPGDVAPAGTPPGAVRARKYADPGRAALSEKDELRVKGNRLVNRDGREVWLQGVAIPSLEWRPDGDHVRESVEAAVCDWNVNVIRLALYGGFWFGRGKGGKDVADDGGDRYRRLVDELVDSANRRGVYVVLDLHEYRAAQPSHAEFWRDAARRYANRPGVLFDILNEPYGISWREWRDGGALKDGGGKAAAETLDGRNLTQSIGMQRLVDEIRQAGARNLIIAGGLDWAYDCSGILGGYALTDRTGNGIAYSVHVYPWKSGWQKAFLDCAAVHPLFLGEVGCMDKMMPFEKKLRDPYVWAPQVLSCIQANRLNWTAWSFHPQADPCVIEDWTYTPTACWGAFVRAALRGARFASEWRQQENLQ